MKEFLVSKGWNFVGKCSCNPPMDIYTNPLYNKKEIRIGTAYFRIMDVSNPLNKITLTGGMESNFQMNYNMVFK